MDWALALSFSWLPLPAASALAWFFARDMADFWTEGGGERRFGGEGEEKRGGGSGPCRETTGSSFEKRIGENHASPGTHGSPRSARMGREPQRARKGFRVATSRGESRIGVPFVTPLP